MVNETERAEVARPSRAEIESLCILDVAGRGDGTLADLAERLGVARELAPAIEEAIGPLVALGHLDVGDVGVSLTKAGRDWLQRRLSELGCRQGASTG